MCAEAERARAVEAVMLEVADAPLAELQLRFLGALDPAAPPLDAALLAAVNATRRPRRGAAVPDLRRHVPGAPARRAPRGLPARRGVLGDATSRRSRAATSPPSVDPSVGAPRGTPLRRLARRRRRPSRRLADLARLECARVDVFDAADAEPLRLGDLESVPPDEWPALRLRLIPACLVLESAWPVHEIWAAADPEARDSEVWL